MKNCLILKIFILSLFLYSCKDMSSQPSFIFLSEDDQIRYVVFSNQIGENNSAEYLMFLGLNDEDGISGNRYDPSEQLILAMQLRYLNIRKISQAAWDSRGHVCDKLDSTKKGSIIITCPLSWTSPSEVNLKSAVQLSLRAASGFRWFLHKQNNTWVIDSVKTTWLS